MTPQECLRIIRLVRFQPLKGRRITMAELARLTGYNPHSLHRVSRRGTVSHAMAARMTPILARLTLKTGSLFGGEIASAISLGRLLEGPDPRGSWARRKGPAGARRTPHGHQGLIDERKTEADQ